MNRRRGVLIAGATGLLLLGAGAAYGAQFHDRALPGTTVAGRSVAGLTRAQVAERLTTRANAVAVTLRVGPTTTTSSPARLGYAVDVDATVASVFAPNASWTSYATALVSRRVVTPVVTADRATVDSTIRTLVAGSGKGGSDAKVVLAPDGGSFRVQPPVPGATIAPADFTVAVEGAAKELTSTTVTLPMVAAPPAVTTAQAQRVADAANALLAQAVTVSDGTTTYTPTAAERAGWVRIPTADGVPGSPTLDPSKVAAWVAQAAASTDVTVTDGVRVVDAEGRVLSVVTRAADGRTVTNQEQVVAQLTAALRAGTAYAGTFTVDQVAAGWTSQQVAVGAPVYSASPGEKWIDVNLSNHTITAYEGSTVVRGPIAMVNGAKATPTVVGTFHIYSKVASQTMRGNNADGTRYETPGVPWISYFYSGYALHGAPWRKSFGYTGSHGCINLPVPVAKWVYSWAPVGTTVVTHR